MKRLSVLALCAPLSLLAACGSDSPSGVPATCNNGVLDVGEACDGSNLANTTCAGIAGFTGGVLTCKDCKFVTTACTAGISYEGTYELRSTYDLSSFLPDYVTTLNIALKNPGNYLLDEIAGQLVNNDPTLTLLVKSLLGVYMGNYFASLNSPAVQKMSAAVNAAVDFSKAVTVVSTVKLTAPTTVGGDVQVQENWTELLYTWNYGCTASDTACKEHRLPMSGLTDTQTYVGAGLDLNSSVPRIKLASLAAPRAFSAPYKDIIKDFYEKVIIPKVTGDPTTTTIPALMIWLIDCPGVAADIAKSDDASDTNSNAYSGLGFAINVSVIQTACVFGVNSLGTKLDASLTAALDLGAVNVSGYGEGKLVDSNADKKVDSITDGVWSGMISLVPTTGTTMTISTDGTFTATHK